MCQRPLVSVSVRQRPSASVRVRRNCPSTDMIRQHAVNSPSMVGQWSVNGTSE